VYLATNDEIYSSTKVPLHFASLTTSVT